MGSVGNFLPELLQFPLERKQVPFFSLNFPLNSFFLREFLQLSSDLQRIMEKLSSGEEVGGAGGAYSYNALKRLDQIWSGLRSAPIDSEKIPQVVSRTPGSFPKPQTRSDADPIYDVIVCGGTLGIFVATALASKGLNVGVVERNILKGREQEWNISRKELLELVQVGVLSNDEAEYVIASEFNPNRCGFENKGDIWVQDILNLGVSPAKLLDVVKKRFIALGGALFEARSLSNISIYDDAAILTLSDGEVLPCRLVIDSMGNFSPIVRQIRGGRKPDGMCLVVGTCCRGFDTNTTSDVIYSSSSAKYIGNSPVQYFWEAFPAGSGPLDRTTYMFTYVDPQGAGPALEDLLEDYWDLMPTYQGTPLEKLEILRVIYGIFPTYQDSPLPAAFDRVLQVGDASGIQSPVSFGGFGSMTRHLGRLSTGIHEAMAGDFLDKESLGLLNPYMPNLSASWMFQRAMSARSNSGVSSTFINELLFANFQSMKKLGDTVLRPFLQDVIQFEPLVQTLGLVMLTQPRILPSIFKQVGVGVILDWSIHFFTLGYFSFLSSFIDPMIRSWVESLPPRERYKWRRYLDAWKYGAGLDYHQE
ncbi:Lycopene cyclase protein [Carex littledalei]|uniref:Lycopene cyclase protein n=1 Tax=Carex littledalei TaxID=544730 RepID=A0A833VRQ3_9POAL|nr:Lycopene cyclase protein [Carex littledalei]